MSKVTMNIKGSDVEVTLPEAKVLSSSIDKKTLDENSYISSENGWNKNSITATDQTKAIDDYQKIQENVFKDEDGRSYWIDLLTNVLGIDNVTERLNFESKWYSI